MGNLTLNELSNSLNDYMDEMQNMEDHSLMTENKTIVSAINEIYGKQLIADAIGEPLNENDTFSAMSNDINGLLSQFKTNMMNSGVTVESGDRFKQLIDKIATMAEEGNSKRIQFAEGVISSITLPEAASYGLLYSFNNTLNFEPNILLVCLPNTNNSVTYNYVINSTIHNSSANKGVALKRETPCYLYIDNNNDLYGYIASSATGTFSEVKWYAIGVGEENTTLRDSGFNISSATTLPSTGKENDICVITDNPVNNFEITCNLNDVDSDTSKIKLYLGTKSSNDGLLGTLISDVKNNVTINYHFNKVYQGNTRLSSFYFKDDSWKPFTVSCVELIKDGIQNATSIAGELSLGGYWQQNSGYVQDTGSRYYYNTTGFQTKIDFTPFTKLVVRAKTNSSSRSLMIYATPTNYTVSSLTNSNSITYNYIASQQFNTTLSSKEFDISSWTGEHYLTLSLSTSDYPFLLYDMLLY